jgi:hypothetical protein
MNPILGPRSLREDEGEVRMRGRKAKNVSLANKRLRMSGGRRGRGNVRGSNVY